MGEEHRRKPASTLPGPVPPEPSTPTADGIGPDRSSRPTEPGAVASMQAPVRPEGSSPRPVAEAPSGAKALSPGRLLGERYRLVRRIGSGGMGEVWEAVHVVIEKPVAVKILLDDDAAADQQLPERFMREAHAIAAIGHENVVDITDFGHTAWGAPYFVMELLEGETIKAIIKKRGALTWPRARNLLLQLIDGLQAVHDRGIVHRDLKPDNVFVVARGRGRESCKIIDFGIAKVTRLDGRARAFTRTGMVFGTPAFMSPEQARGEPVDLRADVYAFGCLAYEILTGRRVFEGDTPTELLFKQLFTEPSPLRTHVSGLLPELEAVVLKCLRKQPSLRFQSMAEVREALLQVGTGAPAVVVPAESLPEPPSAPSMPGRDDTRSTVTGLREDRRRSFTMALTVLALVIAAGVAFLTMRRLRTQPEMDAGRPEPRVVAPADDATRRVTSPAPSGPVGMPAEGLEAVESEAPAVETERADEPPGDTPAPAASAREPLRPEPSARPSRSRSKPDAAVPASEPTPAPAPSPPRAEPDSAPLPEVEPEPDSDPERPPGAVPPQPPADGSTAAPGSEPEPRREPNLEDADLVNPFRD